MRAGAIAAVVAACAAGAGPIWAQSDPGPRETSAVPPDQIVSAYLEQLGLMRLQAEDLAQRIAKTSGVERVQMAERLGRLYVRLLSDESTPDDRKKWEDRSRELLRTVPEADTYDLRLALNKALYLQAEDIIERHRLRLATPAEVSEAELSLRALKPQLEEIGTRANRRAEHLKTLEEKGDFTDKMVEELADAQRARSQAFYYAGWSAYYLALLTRADEPAADAMKDFGWLLNSSGSRIASIERLPKELLKYEHIARAAIGCGLATALRGNETLGLRWLEEVENAEDLPESVKPQLLSRRITILSDARRWADLERLIRLERHSDRSGDGENVARLSPGAARLLAIVTLEADKSLSRELIEPLSAIAFGDLVAQGELAQVLDLVKRYGTAPIGDTGFIVYHVRGLQQYEAARDLHKAEVATDPSGTDAEQATAAGPETPAKREETIKAYREAAVLLEGAVSQPDADSFKTERAQASLFAGLALYYAGDLSKAAQRFHETATLTTDKKQASEALWLAVVALDKAVESGDASLTKARDEAAALFLQSDPDGERAARLLIRRAMTGVLDPEESIKILLGVAKDSPMYAPSRQHAARLLYNQYRSASAGDHDFAAMRFVGVAEEALSLDRRTALEGGAAEAAEAAQRIVIRVRQILDALLSVATPDVPRAEAALETLRTVAATFTIDLSAYEHELTFRRFQIALAKDDGSAAAALGEQLRAAGGPYSLAADQHMFRRATQRYQRARESGADTAEAAREVVRAGAGLIARVKEGGRAALEDPSNRTLYLHVSRAAFELFESAGDSAMRDLSLELDKKLLGVIPNAQEPLRRVASTSEAAGDVATALDCWRTLLSGLTQGSGAWFEARYHSMRLLAASDPGRARAVLQQHTVLYPAYGPEPWGAKIKDLERALGMPAAPAPSGTEPKSPPAPNGGER